MLLFCVSLAYPGPYSRMFSLSDDIYQDMDALYAIAGEVVPSTSRPWSQGEAQLILHRIDSASLPVSGRRLYDRLSKIVDSDLRWKFGDGFELGLGLETSVEMYAHSNGESFKIDTDWIYNYERRTPFLRATLDMGLYNYFYTFCDLQYAYGRYSDENGTFFEPSSPVGALITQADLDTYEVLVCSASEQYVNPFGLNIPPQSALFEFDWPKRAFVSFGGKTWNLFFGRDKITWGNSHIGNFILDSHVQYHDMARLSLYSDHFKYEWANLFFKTHPGRDETTPETMSRLLMAHRLEFRPWSWLSFVISENIMYQAPSLNMKYLNPGFIFHNLNDRSMFNAIGYAELALMPLKGWLIYGQFVLDQARAPNEGDEQSNAWGVSVGTEYTHGLGDGYMTSDIEFAYTMPVLYRRDKVDFLMYQDSYTLGRSHVLKLNYIGFPYGGDVMMLHVDVSYHLPGSFQAGLKLEGILKGEMNMFASHSVSGDNNEKPNYPGGAPSGDAITQIGIISLYGEYEVPELWNFLRLSFWTELDFVGRRLYRRSTGSYSDSAGDIQFVMGMKVSL